MTLDKEDIATANEMAKTLQQSKNSELIVVGNLLAHLLAERLPQRQWVGLTDDEKELIVGSSCKKDSSHDDAERVAKAIEEKLKEKNTP